MFPIHINPIGPQLVPSVAATMYPDLTWVAAVAVVGVVTLLCRIACAEARSRDCQPRYQMSADLSAQARKAA